MRLSRVLRYESEVRLFILLLALFFIISPWGSLYLLRKTRLVLSQELDQGLVSVARLTRFVIRTEEIEEIRRRLIPAKDFSGLQISLSELALNSGVARIFFLSPRGRILLDSQTRDTYGKDVYTELEGVGDTLLPSPFYLNLRSGQRNLRSYVCPLKRAESPPSLLLVVQRESGYLNMIGRLVAFDIAMKIGGFGALLLLGVLFIRSVLRPYRRIGETAREVGKVKAGEDETEFMVRTFKETAKEFRDLASLGEMSAGVAHEFRNSLATIIGYVQLVKRGETGVVDKLLSECRRFNALLNEFLRFAKPAELKPEPVNLREVLSEALSSIDTGKLPASVTVEGSTPWVMGDRLLLRQAFVNIIQNSAEATQKGGSLSITVKSGKEKVGIHFRDSGRGIARSDLDKVLTPFFTTKEGGVGLGLSLVRKIVNGHGGRVRVQSEEGKGTEVLVELPRK